MDSLISPNEQRVPVVESPTSLDMASVVTTSVETEDHLCGKGKTTVKNSTKLNDVY